MTDVATHQKVRRRYRQMPDQVPASKDTRLPLPEMSVEVKNFGPIAKGKVDIRPLTVFAGPSNTGKSWLATLIYALGMLASTRRKDVIDYIRFTNEQYFSSTSFDQRNINFPDNPQEWLQTIAKDSSKHLTECEMNTLKFVANLAKFEMEAELCRCFGRSNPDELIRKAGKIRRASSIFANLGSIAYDMAISTKNGSLSMDVEFSRPPIVSFIDGRLNSGPIDTSSKFVELLIDIDFCRKDKNLTLNDYYSKRLAGECLSNLFGESGIGEIHYLPADRGGIMHTYMTVVNALIGVAARGRTSQEQFLPALTGVLSDFMKKLGVMAKLRDSQDSGIAEMEMGLNDRILRGVVDVESSQTGLPYFVYHPNGWNESLPLVSTSSMVSEIGPISLFLRYFVKPGDLLILEEPEAHLHPTLQRALIQEIVKWVHSGVRVLITTHSEWVVEELDTIVARSKNKTVPRWKPENQVLASDDVGIWGFDFVRADNPNKGTHISEIKWNDDEGGYEVGFYSVMVDQWNEFAQAIDES